MTRVLLDTHVFMWWAQRSPRIQTSWVDAILDPENSVHVSSITGLEIETKKRLGRLVFDHDVSEMIGLFGFESLSVTMAHGVAAGALSWEHLDPFDRLLVAQAKANDMLLLSADKAILSAPGVRVL
jgi:PIN domain nuclease of toxin-antitoxin system